MNFPRVGPRPEAASASGCGWGGRGGREESRGLDVTIISQSIRILPARERERE